MKGYKPPKNDFSNHSGEFWHNENVNTDLAPYMAIGGCNHPDGLALIKKNW